MVSDFLPGWELADLVRILVVTENIMSCWLPLRKLFSSLPATKPQYKLYECAVACGLAITSRIRKVGKFPRRPTFC